MNRLLSTLFCSLALSLITLPAAAQHPQSAPRSHHAEAPASRHEGTSPHADPHHRPHAHHHHHIQEPVTEEEYYVATEEQVNDIITYIKGLSFDDGKLKAAKLCISICPVAAADMAKLLDCFNFEQTKKELAEFAFEYCPDKENYALVIKGFTFENTKVEVATACVSRFPMYAIEIAKLAELFSFDNNRLTVLKAAYPNCIDKEYFAVALETFTFQSSRNEMRTYMNKVDAQAASSEEKH